MASSLLMAFDFGASPQAAQAADASNFVLAGLVDTLSAPLA
jgi:hypothetical protein